MTHITRILYPILVTVACSQRIAPEPITPEAHDLNIPVTSASIPWNLARTTGVFSYLSTDTVIIKLSASPIHTQEILLATTRYTIFLDTLSPRGNISGRIDNFSISTGARIGTPDKYPASRCLHWSKYKWSAKATVNKSTSDCCQTNMHRSRLLCPFCYTT